MTFSHHRFSAALLIGITLLMFYTVIYDIDLPEYFFWIGGGIYLYSLISLFLFGRRKFRHLGKLVIVSFGLISLVTFLLHFFEDFMWPYRFLEEPLKKADVYFIIAGLVVALFIALKSFLLAKERFWRLGIFFYIVFLYALWTIPIVLVNHLLDDFDFFSGGNTVWKHPLQPPYDHVFIYSRLLSGKHPIALSCGKWPIVKVIANIPGKAKNISFLQKGKLLYIFHRAGPSIKFHEPHKEEINEQDSAFVYDNDSRTLRAVPDDEFQVLRDNR